MNKKAAGIGVACGIFLGTTIIVYAITSLFFTSSETSILSKKTVFRFDLTTDITAAEVGPGDSFSVRPVIFNDATEEMYVLIQVDMPTTEDGALYSFEVDDEWTLVESGNGTVVYAYGNNEMTVLCPGDSTSVLTEQMTMRLITNSEYAGIDDINIAITGYAIGVENVPTVPEEAWDYCKLIEESQ